MNYEEGFCFYCHSHFKYRTTGFVINAAKQEFCSPKCCEDQHQKMRRIRKGEATWKDILK